MPTAPPTASKPHDEPEAPRKTYVEILNDRPWKALYNTKRWKALRDAALRRDPVCVDPFKEGCRQPSTIADHKVDHKGDLIRFHDFNNLQGLCKGCHDRKTGRSSHGKPESLPCLDAQGRIVNNG